MKRALLVLLLLAACKQQDAAVMVTVSGPFRIPADADSLSMEVFENSVQIASKQWTLPAQPGGLNQTITLVQSGSSHPHVKLNFELFKTGIANPVGQGTNLADFSDSQTGQVSIEMARTQ